MQSEFSVKILELRYLNLFLDWIYLPAKSNIEKFPVRFFSACSVLRKPRHRRTSFLVILIYSFLSQTTSSASPSPPRLDLFQSIVIADDLPTEAKEIGILLNSIFEGIKTEKARKLFWVIDELGFELIPANFDQPKAPASNRRPALFFSRDGKAYVNGWTTLDKTGNVIGMYFSFGVYELRCISASVLKGLNQYAIQMPRVPHNPYYTYSWRVERFGVNEKVLLIAVEANPKNCITSFYFSF